MCRSLALIFHPCEPAPFSPYSIHGDHVWNRSSGHAGKNKARTARCWTQTGDAGEPANQTLNRIGVGKTVKMTWRRLRFQSRTACRSFVADCVQELSIWDDALCLGNSVLYSLDRAGLLQLHQSQSGVMCYSGLPTHRL